MSVPSQHVLSMNKIHSPLFVHLAQLEKVAVSPPTRYPGRVPIKSSKTCRAISARQYWTCETVNEDNQLRAVAINPQRPPHATTIESSDNLKLLSFSRFSHTLALDSSQSLQKISPVLILCPYTWPHQPRNNAHCVSSTLDFPPLPPLFRERYHTSPPTDSHPPLQHHWSRYRRRSSLHRPSSSSKRQNPTF